MRKFKGNIYFSLLIILSLVLGNSLTAFAETGKATTTKINEYDLISKQSVLSTDRLRELGYSTREVVQVKNYENIFRDKVQELQAETDNELNRLGYTVDEIKIIRNFNGSEAELRALAAEVDITISCTKCKYSSSSNKTNATLKCSWSWDKAPVIKMTDMIGIKYNDWDIDSYSASVNYTHIYGSERDFTKTATKVGLNDHESSGVGFRVEMTQQDNYFWADSGQITLDLVNGGGTKNMSAYTEYGHSTVNVLPTFGWSGGLSLSFDFGKTCDVIDNDTVDRKWS